ncbi:MAG: succinylglutamate desuccinylase/aspartoacylase family protein [Gaiellaceae bacterium]
MAWLANGHELELVIHRLHGAEDGPTLGLVGGIHGDEPLGVETVRRVVSGVLDGDFRGAIVALPVANPYGFQALTRNAPIDMTNLNRVFPGHPDGMLSEQVAHAICERFLPMCDYLIDFHSGGNLATVDYAYLHDDQGLGREFGCEILFAGPSYAGTLGDYARRNGVPAVVPELGGGQQRNDHYLAKGIRGARNVMKAIGMLDGEPEIPFGQRIVHEVELVRPHHGGLLLSAVDATRLGEAVAAGTELGRVVSPYTFEVLEVLTAPFDPSLLVLVREQVTKVDPGDFGFIVANGATAEPA